MGYLVEEVEFLEICRRDGDMVGRDGDGVPAQNILPARMGPTVWDDEGPTPMLNKSKVEMTACSAGVENRLQSPRTPSTRRTVWYIS
jgi:hypothetical protein